jgi:hypothetical protein
VALATSKVEAGADTTYACTVHRALILLVALNALAPLQCPGHQDAAVRSDDGPGEALYDLAQDFRAKGNERACRETLRFIIARYPSSRRAQTSRLELESDGSPQAVGKRWALKVRAGES